MDVQFVFGNPVKRKKVAKRKKSTKIKRRGNPMGKPKRDSKGRFLKRSSAKRRRRRNPDAVTYTKGGKSQKAVQYTVRDKENAAELGNRLASRVSKLEGALTAFGGRKTKSGRAQIKALKKRVTRIRRGSELKRVEARIAKDAKLAEKLLAGGWTESGRSYVPLSERSFGINRKKGSSVARKKKKGGSKKKRSAPKKKRSAPKKKRLAPKKKRSAPKRRRSSKKRVRFIGRRERFATAARKTRFRHPQRRKVRVGRKKYRSVTLSAGKVRKMRNPFGGTMGSMLKSWTGHEVMEAGALALGGGLYGAANGLLAKVPVVKDIHAQMVKIPVVGSALPTLVLGALLHKLGEKQRIAALQTVGKGLVGASVVGMGVNASQMIPGLKAGLSGVDYTRLSGVDYTALGADVSPADFGAGQLGEIPYGELPAGYGADVSAADFGEIAYGELPEGLGEGQMG